MSLLKPSPAPESNSGSKQALQDIKSSINYLQRCLSGEIPYVGHKEVMKNNLELKKQQLQELRVSS